MPEKLNICGEVKFMADEYLRGELGLLKESDKIFIEEHILECKDCLEYIENERKYLEEIKLAEYIPDIDIAGIVMDKIIGGVMAIDKPRRKRFIPVGLMSAAVIVILFAAVSRGGLMNIFIRGDNNINDLNAANERSYGGEYGGSPEIARFNLDVGGGFDENTEAEEDFDAAADVWNDDSPPQPALRAAGEYIPAEAVAQSIFGSHEVDEYIYRNFGLTEDDFYAYYFVGGNGENNTDIIRNIDVYAGGGEERARFVDIIAKGDEETLVRNAFDNYIYVSEILIKNQDGEYIAVVYWFN
ncbi:MAG: zf-HC2 domain-containing protein [Oscillospiraceae bacterium]|nr:zf-HC2 domain-containing protein [Oscillospiraceae bacterium]